MPGESSLLVNMVFALGAAILGASIAVRLGQSVILGYLVAGMAIRPFAPAFVGNLATVESLANIGIILLMFSIGVQLSFRDLLRVGKVAIVGGNLQVLITIGLGYLAGTSMGWSPMEALFLGAAISNSSSTVLTKILDEQGEMDAPHGRIALAWSSVQDLGTVLLVVVLSALASGGESILGNALWATAMATIFLAVLATVGSVALPWVFERISALRSREVFILMVAMAALGTAYLSTYFGLSLALGAFVAGVVVSESDLSYQILGEVTPLRDVFAGLFFVSIGMLVNPLTVAENPWPVLITISLIVLAKGLLCSFIVALFGYAARTSLLTGVTLAQSAEFSFLLARLGADLGVVSPSVFNVLMAGIATSMALSPILHRAAQPMAKWVEGLAGEPPGAPGGKQEALRGHAVVCGYGRVGRIVVGVLRRRRFPVVVVDEDRRVVQRLREQGTPAFLGNAANPVLLDRVGLGSARILVVAIPDPLTVRQLVDYARRNYPRLDIVARTHQWAEREFLTDRGVGEAVMGEVELALEMTRRTLRHFGMDAREAQVIVQGLRRRVKVGPAEDMLDDAA